MRSLQGWLNDLVATRRMLARGKRHTINVFRNLRLTFETKMTITATKENFSEPIDSRPRVQRCAIQCREVMTWTAKAWLGLVIVFTMLPLVGADITPVNYYALNVLMVLFIGAAAGRVICAFTFVVTGVEIRAKDELFFVPSDVPVGWMQRIYMSAGL